MSLDTEQSQYIDNGDGTITDTYNSLMWKKADSWCDFGHLITQVQSLEYLLLQWCGVGSHNRLLIRGSGEQLTACTGIRNRE